MIGPLEGGGRRRRGRRRRGAGAIAVLVAFFAVATGVVLLGWLALDGRRRGESPSPALPTAVTPQQRGAGMPAHAPGAVSFKRGDAVGVRFRRPPRAGLLFDLRTGRVLWRRRPHKRLPIASLAKIMTAIVVVERTRPRERARITRAALAYSGSGVGVLPRPGRKVPVDGLLAGLLLVSGNDAAIALAGHVAGSERRFVRIMNAKARALGLRCTRFVSASGLESANRSCAADLAALTRIAMAKRRIARLARRRQAAVSFPIRGGRLYLNSTNPLLRMRYRGTIGLKTGSTRRAGHSFVGVARRGRRTLGVVLLRSPDSGAQARKLLDRAFRTRSAG